MKMNRVLATVSVVALTTAAGMTGARADNVLYDLSAIPPTITAAAASASVITSNQLDSVTSITATNSVTLIGAPLVGTHDLEGGTDSVFVDINDIFAEATGNTKTNSVDLNTATGAPTLNAATAATLQVNFGGGTATLDAAVTTATIRADFEDAGTGSNLVVDANTVRADAVVNEATNTVAGDINQLLTSTEAGGSVVSLPGTPNELTAGATVLTANAQLIDNLASPMASVDETRIGLGATVDGTPASLVGVNLDVTDNLVRARFNGNDATNRVAVADGGAVTLNGTAGVANLQSAAGVDAFAASITNTVIELGDTSPVTDEAIADLTGSTAEFTGNDILGAVASNSSVNSVALADTVSQNPVNGTQVNAVDFTGGTLLQVGADLFVQNVQYAEVDANANVNGDLNVLIEDVSGSTVLADGNSVGATATGNATVNAIGVGDATTFSSITAVQSVQYAEGAQIANSGASINGSNLSVSIASLNANGDIVSTAVSTTDNRLYTEAMGNTHDSSIAIDGTTLNSVGGLNGAGVDRSLSESSIAADTSLLTGQVLDGGGAQATTISRIRVDASLAGTPTSDITSSTIDTSENEISALAIGNLSTEASIALDATSVGSGAAVVSVQTVEDGASLSARTDSPIGNQSQVEVWGFPAQIVDSSINTDGNVFSARVFGNLVDGTGNSLDVDATTITSNNLVPGNGSANNRSLPGNTAFADMLVINDQSVEDLEGSVVTAVNGQAADAGQGDLVFVRIGLSDQFALSNTDFTINDNQGVVAATLNQAVSSATVAAVTNNAGTALLNVQSVRDEDGNGSSAGLVANQYDADMTLSIGANADGAPLSIADGNFEIVSNDLLASGRVNLATNTVAVSGQSQTIVGKQTAGQETAVLDVQVETFGVTSLLNDQSFVDLSPTGIGSGVGVVNDNSDFSMVIATDGAFANSVAQIDDNTMRVQALGNDASNSLTVAIDTFDLSQAAVGATPLNLSLGSLVSRQEGITDTAADGEMLANAISVRAILDMSDVTGSISGADITTDGNSMRTIARTNNVTNVLTATGTTLPDVEGVTAPSAAVLDDTSGVAIVYTDAVFGVASQQTNGIDITSVIEGSGGGTPSGMRIVADGAATIDGTDLSASGNAIVAEARGNDSGNGASLNYTSNSAQVFVTNVQQVTDYDPFIEARVFDAEILVDVDGDTIGIAPVINASSVVLDGNAIAALASSNRTTNSVSVSGTNVLSGSDAASRGVVIDNGLSPLIGVTGDIALINAQGATAFTSPDQDEELLAVVDTANIVADVATLNTGSVSIDNNVVLSQGIVQNASNTLALNASANVGAVGDTPNALLMSYQAFADDSEVNTDTFDVTIGVIDAANTGAVEGIADMADLGSASASVAGNSVSGVAMGGTATNRLTVTAGAEIVGGTAAPVLTVGNPENDPVTFQNADYTVVNLQVGLTDGSDIEADVDNTLIGVSIASDIANDSLTVDNNLVQAQVRGFASTNTLALTAGSSSDATAQVGNLQFVDGFDDIQGEITDTTIIATVDGGALNSGVSVSDNLVSASTAGNTALNALSTTAQATLQESSGAGSVLTPGGAVEIAVTGTDYAVLNRQSVSDVGEIDSTIGNAAVGIDDLSGAGGVDATALDVNGNTLLASATANDAVNSLVLNTGTFQHPSSSIASLQTTSDTTVSASASNVSVGVGLGGGLLSGTSSNSSVTVRGNVVGATAIGNSAVSAISGN
ncbi:hypothetical protein [Iodidimonas sp. SYSU 1G8]|uniref:beta strand repeat-containing protein n=1 Tax=Iodidimonas sp. SYSU 1G8 TaxID=3133967 RepID=UPI0031FEB226